MEKLLKCVKVGSKIKVSVIGEKGFVQFPNNLRKLNDYYVAEISWNGKFWKLNSSPIKASSEMVFKLEQNAIFEKNKKNIFEKI